MVYLYINDLKKSISWHIKTCNSPYGCLSYQKSVKTSRNRPETARRVISRKASLKPQSVDKVNQNKHEKSVKNPFTSPC